MCANVCFVYVCMTHWILFALENIVQMTFSEKVYEVKMCEGKSMGKLGYFITLKRHRSTKVTELWMQRRGSAKMLHSFLRCGRRRRHHHHQFHFTFFSPILIAHTLTHSLTKIHSRKKHIGVRFTLAMSLMVLQLEFQGIKCHDTIRAIFLLRNRGERKEMICSWVEMSESHTNFIYKRMKVEESAIGVGFRKSNRKRNIKWNKWHRCNVTREMKEFWRHNYHHHHHHQHYKNATVLNFLFFFFLFFSLYLLYYSRISSSRPVLQ